MTWSLRSSWRLGLLALTTAGLAACEGELAEPAIGTDDAAAAPSTELVDAPSATLAEGHVVLAEFSFTFDPASEDLSLEWIEPSAWYSEANASRFRDMGQGEFCSLRTTQGRPDTVTLETVAGSIGFTPAECGVSGFVFDSLGVFCFEADLRNNYGVPLTEAYAEVTQVSPDTGYNGYRFGDQTEYGTDPATVGLDAPPSERPSDVLGLFSWGEIAPGATSRAVWGFENDGGAFSFRGRIVGIVPESCNNRDDDCDGEIDERGLCYGAGDACLFDNDCSSGFCDAGLCSATDSCSTGVQDALETDVDCGGAICDACAFGQMCAVDSDCDTGTCRNGTCANYPHPAEGEMVLTELLPNPAGSDTGKEWVEFLNTSSEILDLGQCELSDLGSDSHIIVGELAVNPGEYVVLGSGAAAGGGADYVYSSYFLSNSGDEVVLTCSGVVVDTFSYGSAFDTSGFASQLDANTLNAASNDSETAFCTSGANIYDDGTADASGDVQYGSPGAANVSCDITIDNCRFSAPVVDFDAQENGAFTLAGQLTSAGLTDLAVGLNPNGRIVAEVGFGPVAEDPSVDDSNWTWTSATGDNAFSDATYDQYAGDISTPAGVGNTYKVAFRVSGDLGTSFTYCDTNVGAGQDGSEDGFSLANVPTMTLVGPVAAPSAPGDVRISELMARSISGTDNGEWFELHNPGTEDLDLGGCFICDDACDASSNDHEISGELVIPAGGYITLGASAVVGFTPDYQYTGVLLSNSSDDLLIDCGGTTIDAISYTTSTPGAGEIRISTSTPGVSAQLIPDDVARLAIHGDLTKTWCSTPGSNIYNSGYVGTPGAANPECVVLTSCNTQFPTSIAGVAPTSTSTVFGQVITAELSSTTTGTDTSPILVVQAGTGPTGSDPSTDDTGWNWVDGSANTGFSNGSGIDEYQADITAPSTGLTTVDYAFRVSDDGGASWTHCDVGDVSTAGSLDGYNVTASLSTEQTYTIGFCNLQFPDNVTNDAGATVTMYNQVYIAGQTDGGGTYSPPSTVVSQFGYSASGNPPNDVDWTWDASGGGNDVGSNYEFEYTLTVPSAVGGPYASAFRVSGDGGQTWSYCGASNSFNADPSAITLGTIAPAVRTIGYVVQNFPTTISGNPGDAATVFGLYYAAGLTDQSDGVDPSTDIEAAFGYGPTGVDPAVDPAAWTWIDATPNLAYNDGGCCGANNNNDEYMADFNLPLTPGTYNTAYRFRANSGATWVYGDTAGNPWTSGNTGTMTVVGAAGACTTGVLISEYLEGTSNNKVVEIWNCTNSAIPGSDVGLVKYGNAATSWDGFPSITAFDSYGIASIPADGVVLLCNSSLSTPSLTCDHSTGGSPMNFNGDDALVLFYQGNPVDSLGRIADLLGGPGQASYGANRNLERNNCTGDPNVLPDSLGGDGQDGTQNFTSTTSPSNFDSSFGTRPAGVTCP